MFREGIDVRVVQEDSGRIIEMNCRRRSELDMNQDKQKKLGKVSNTAKGGKRVFKFKLPKTIAQINKGNLRQLAIVS